MMLREGSLPTQLQSEEPLRQGVAGATQGEALRLHLSEILRGPSFRGSPRAGQFLSFLVERLLEGRTESLRERNLGIAVFGRPPGFDTSSDAIVRVTASDVRRRLKQHYERTNSVSSCRISLPIGTYVPEIQFPVLNPSDTVESPAPASPSKVTAADAKGKTYGSHWRVIAAIGAIVVFNLVILVLMFRSLQAPSKFSEPPWSAILEPGRTTQIIASDPNIAEIQRYTKGQISLSDYANRKYVPNPEELTPGQLRFSQTELRGDKASMADLPFALSVAEHAAKASVTLKIRGARDLQFSDLKTDDNYILLGSPRSNPWANLYNERLDFRFLYNPGTGREFIRNFHQLPGEHLDYLSTAPGWATGESFAIAAILRNPDQAGKVLLVAGETAEGTEAAGRLLSDSTRFRDAFRICGSKARGNDNFELLFHLSAVAGSWSKVDTIACHIL